MNYLRLLAGIVVATACGCNSFFPSPTMARIPKYATYRMGSKLPARSEHTPAPKGEQPSTSDAK